jgi:hypothetical protein
MIVRIFGDAGVGVALSVLQGQFQWRWRHLGAFFGIAEFFAFRFSHPAYYFESGLLAIRRAPERISSEC